MYLFFLMQAPGRCSSWRRGGNAVRPTRVQEVNWQLCTVWTGGGGGGSSSRVYLAYAPAQLGRKAPRTPPPSFRAVHTSLQPLSMHACCQLFIPYVSLQPQRVRRPPHTFMFSFAVGDLWSFGVVLKGGDPSYSRDCGCHCFLNGHLTPPHPHILGWGL